MKRLLSRFVVVFCSCLFLAATATGAPLKSVYLKDGGVIECLSFSKKNGMLEVMVNRDVVIELANDEVDLTRTFAQKPVKPKKKKAKTASKALSAVVSKAPAGAVPPATKSAASPAGAVPLPAKAAATPAVPPTAKAGAAQQPVVGQPATKPGAPPAASVPPAAKPGAPPAAAVPPAAKSGAVAAPAASTASSPQAKPQADVKPSASPSDTPTRKTLPLIATKPAVPVNDAMTALIGGGMLAPILLVMVILIVSFWKVFSKAGEAGWKSIIPIYNVFVLVKIAGKPWWWFLLLFVPLVNLVIAILMSISLANRFDKGALFGLGLAFFGFIFYPVLAFGKATYR